MAWATMQSKEKYKRLSLNFVRWLHNLWFQNLFGYTNKSILRWWRNLGKWFKSLILPASSFKCKPCLRILSIFFVQNEHKGNYGLLQMRNIRKIRIYDMYNSYHNFAARLACKEKWDVETFLLASAKYYKAGTCHFYSLSH